MNEIKSKGIYQACEFFFSTPMYSFSDFLRQRPLKFKNYEISQIERILAPKKMYRILYKSQVCEGKLFIDELDEKEFVNVRFVDMPEFKVSVHKSKVGLKYFLTLKTPPNFCILYFVTVGLIFIAWTKLFPFDHDQPMYFGSACDIDCLKNFAAAFKLLSLYLAFSLGGIGISLYFFFIKSKKTKDYNLKWYIKFTASLMAIVLTCNVFHLGREISKPPHYSNFFAGYQAIFHPESLKRKDYRIPASEALDFVRKTIRK